MGCVSILEICFFDIIIVCDVIHSWRQQNMSNKWIRKHVTDLKNSPRSFCVDVIKLCSLSGFLRFDLSYAWMLMEFWILWKFSQVIFY